jgi:hypothetical protein
MGEYYQPGMGAYYSPSMAGLGGKTASNTTKIGGFQFGPMFWVNMALDALGGYAVGKALGHPVAGTIGGAFGLTGLFIATLYSVRSDKEQRLP